MKKLFLFCAVLLGSISFACAQTSKNTSQKPPTQQQQKAAAAKRTAELMKIKDAALANPAQETGFKKAPTAVNR